MTARKVWWSGAWVTLGGGGGGSATDQYPSALLPDGVNTASSVRNAITATASATPHTPGAWVEVDASLSADASGVCVVSPQSTNGSATDSSTLMEIGIGAAAAETVWATIGFGYRVTNNQTIFVPGFIAAGTRVAIRARSVTVSKVIVAKFSFLTEKSVTVGAPVTYGADTATSHGLALTDAGAINTKSAWTQITASTASALSQINLTCQCNADLATGSSGILIDIGVDPGGGSSYTTVIPDVEFLSNASEAITSVSPTTYGVAIAAGSSIAARWQRAGATDQNALDLIVVGA